MSEKMMKQEQDQALPITAGLVTTTAFFAMLWSFADGWMTQPGWESMGLPGLFLDPDMKTVVSFKWIVILRKLLVVSLQLYAHNNYHIST